MENLKYDGTPDRRFTNRQNDTIVQANQILPYKDGYIQFVFKPVVLDSEWVAKNNKVVSRYESEKYK